MYASVSSRTLMFFSVFSLLSIWSASGSMSFPVGVEIMVSYILLHPSAVRSLRPCCVSGVPSCVMNWQSVVFPVTS